MNVMWNITFIIIKKFESNREIFGVYHDEVIIGEIQLKYINLDENLMSCFEVFSI